MQVSSIFNYQCLSILVCKILKLLILTRYKQNKLHLILITLIYNINKAIMSKLSLLAQQRLTQTTTIIKYQLR